MCFPLKKGDKKEGTALVGAHGLTVTPAGTYFGGVAMLVIHGPGADWG